MRDTALTVRDATTGDAAARAFALAVVLWLLAAGYAGFTAWELARGYTAAARGDTPLYTDYTSLHAAALLARRGPAEELYRPRPMYEATVDTAYLAYGEGLTADQAKKVGYSPWMYPPHYLLFVLPLAWLPYLPAFLLWIGATLVPYLAAMRLIVRDRLAVPLGLAAPPAFFNLAYGQSGYLVGGLIGLGLALLGRRPWLAGVFIGLASVKPHFGLLVPLALAAGGHWRAFGGAALTVLGLVVASIVVLGPDPWYGFIGTALFHLDGFRAGAYTWASMTSVLSTAHMAGVGLDAAWRLQYAAAAAMALVVAWAWWRGRTRADTLGLQSAILCLATPLAVPMVYLYDLVLIVPAAAWLWTDLRARGGARWEWALLAAASGGMLGVFLVASRLELQTGALLVGALLGLAIRRYRAALQVGTKARPGPVGEPAR